MRMVHTQGIKAGLNYYLDSPTSNTSIKIKLNIFKQGELCKHEQKNVVLVVIVLVEK